MNGKTNIRIIFIMIAFIAITLQRYLKFMEDGATYLRLTNYIAFIFILLSFDFRKFNKGMVIFSLLLPLGFFIRRYLPIWITFALVFQLIQLKISVRQLAGLALIIVLGEIAMQYYMVTTGIVHDTVIRTIKASGHAHTWGMKNGNNLASFFMQAYTILYLLTTKKTWIPFIAFSLITGYGVYMYTCSRTPYYSLIAMCAMVLLYRSGVIWNWTKYIVGALPVILFVITFYLSMFMGGAGRGDLDELTSGRLGIAQFFFSHMTRVTLIFGMDRPEDMPLDSGYIDMLMQGGLLYVSAFCLIFFRAMNKSFDKIKFYLPFLLGILASGLAESTFSVLTAVTIIMWVVLFRSAFPERISIESKTRLKTSATQA